MPNCSSCGSSIPEGQGRSCSMCYGDPNHGKDNYYNDWIEEQMREEEENDLQEEMIDTFGDL